VAGGGFPSYSFTWSTGANTASITVCPASGTNFTVTVTDASGAQSTDAVSVEVVNVQCGIYLDKVLLCHSENGNSQTICIAAAAVPAHLSNHDDHLGPCGTTPCTGAANQHLLIFNANLNEEMAVKLTWVNRFQSHSDRFLIEKSADGVLFEPLVEREASGPEDKLKSYLEYDFNPVRGDNYYRLKLTRQDGIVEYSQIEKIHFNPSSGFEVYPNPAGWHVNIFMENFIGKEDVDLVISDRLGRALHRRHLPLVENKIFKIDLGQPSIPAGLYLVSVVYRGLAVSKTLAVIKAD
jgi:hypothetical protein